MLPAPPSTLGSRLKAERLRRGLTLEQVSASTKILAKLLEALERDDLSRWPKGLYRRAFFRAYVSALGLSPDPLVAEFTRVFPDEPIPGAPVAAPRTRIATDVVDSAIASATEDSGTERLALASGRVAAVGRRSLLLALVELAAVFAVGSVVAWLAGITLLMGSGAVALVYYPVARATAGRIRWNTRTRRRAGPLAANGFRSTLGSMQHEMQHVKQHAVRHVLPLVMLCRPRARQAAMHANTGLSSFAFAVTIHRFWKGVLAAAEYAQLLAARQLNRRTTE